VGDRSVIFEDVSPNGNVQAVVEDDGSTVYFYLFFPDAKESDGIKSCWVQNRRPAPANLDKGSMQRGEPPLLPANYCRHADAQDAPRAERLRVVWFEEGNGAALLEGDEVLAVVPCWSGSNGFHGYARDCTAESPVCWPLTPDNVLFDRIRKAQEFWRSCEAESFWEQFRDPRVRCVDEALGTAYANYYAIDGGAWPPRALLRYKLPDKTVEITVGMAIRPQPNVELFTKSPEAIRRIELAAALPPDCPGDEAVSFSRFLSGAASYPWRVYSWLGEGHTISCNAVPPSLGGEGFSAVLLTGQAAGAPALAFPPFRGDPTNVLWLVPITGQEREFAEREGSSTLIAKLTEAGVGVVHRQRGSVV
jgi:hypothetical protein